MSAPAKVAIIGSEGVGKTTLVNYIVNGEFSSSTPSTIGASFESLNYQGKSYNFWDTAGKERYRGMISMYYRGAAVVVFVFNPCDLKSFQEIESFRKSVAESVPNALMILACNDGLLGDNNPAVSQEEIDQYISQHPAFRGNFIRFNIPENIGITDIMNSIYSAKL